jgi:alkanesulfonate monooxygenase SsuD/methylene tetrahydromethanopterin reductase-like flavin-dependent oxidoreductase (luciferase family)
VSEGWFGTPYRGIVDACGEVLDALTGLFSDARRADVDGAHVRIHASTALRAPAPGVVLAAMGPRMIRLAGTHADGTLTWMSGPAAVAVVAERLNTVARDAGRPAPRVAVGIPVCVTDRPAEARARMAGYLDMAARMPAYRRQLDIEGVTQPVDLAVVGTESEVDTHLERFVEAGMTELCANIVGAPEEVERTMAHLATRRAS